MPSLPGIYFGGRDVPPAETSLKAGRLSCIYSQGAVRQIRAGDTEILRMIYPAVRDRDWGTVPGIIQEEEIRRENDSFSIRYTCLYRQEEIEYLAHYHIEGKKDDVLIFRMEGKALASFLRNRIGLNILHPIDECAGRKCRVSTPEGEKYETEFPLLISPLQPMQNIRSMHWSPADTITASLELSGEVFEMEDHRNWTDASYKTYGTPLDLPFPARVEKGDELRQEACLKVMAENISAELGSVNRIAVKKGPLLDFPALGTCRTSDVHKSVKGDLEKIGHAGFTHYRVDLELYRDGWREILEEGAAEAAGMKLALEPALFFGGDPGQELARLLESPVFRTARISHFLVYTRDHLNSPVLSGLVIPELKKKFPGVPVGCGTNANFAELNRNRPELKAPEDRSPDLLCWSINPQVHAFDYLSLVENLKAQADTVRTAREFAVGKPLVVSPVSLRPRFNAVATSDEVPEEKSGMPFRFDARQVSLFCAGWTLGSLKYLAESGVSSVSYYEATGRGGIIHGDSQPVSPGHFLAGKGDLYPVYFLFRELGTFYGSRVRGTADSRPLRFSSLLLEKGEERLLAIANHTVDELKLSFPDGIAGQEGSGRAENRILEWTLDEYSLEGLRRGENNWHPFTGGEKVSLRPFAVKMIKTIIT